MRSDFSLNNIARQGLGDIFCVSHHSAFIAILNVKNGFIALLIQHGPRV